jgi:hypothetical protein
MSGLAYLTPDCWLEVSLHPEGPSTGQLDQGFPWFSFGPREHAELVPKFHVALHAEHAALPVVTQKISPYCTPPDVELKFLGCNPFNAEWTRHQDILSDWPLVET